LQAVDLGKKKVVLTMRTDKYYIDFIALKQHRQDDKSRWRSVMYRSTAGADESDE
jgi:hypothetical protein